MPRTYTDIPEPRKVLEADTIRGYSRETVEEALQGGGGGGISISTQYTIDWNTDRESYELLSVDSYASFDEANAALDNTQSEAIIATLNGGLFNGTIVTLMPGVRGGHYAVFYMGGIKIVTIGIAVTDIDGRYYLTGDVLMTAIS